MIDKRISAVTRIALAALAASSLAWLAACAGTGTGKTSTDTGRHHQDRSRGSGEHLYILSCSNCHGAHARGDGPVAPLLKVTVPDLTLIAARRGGVFPADEIYRVVDGQADLTAHGSRHMPVWGYEFFGADADDKVAHRQATEKIDRLVHFLQSVQRNP